MADTFEIYERLWRRAQDDGAYVHYFFVPGVEQPSLTSDPSGAAGWCIANADVEDAQPVIQIYRLECDDESFTPSRTRGHQGAHLPPPDLDEELITLAHEYGHLRSFLGETPRPEWELYDAAARHRSSLMELAEGEMSDGLSPQEQSERSRSVVLAGLTQDERNRIVTEETLAWSIGRSTLAELGMKDFERYDARAARGLHNHRYRLGMEEAWPGDELGTTSE